MGKVIMSGVVPQLVAPVTEIMLSELAEGSIVKLNEDGSPVEFYVAKHNYESGLNGTGRTLLVRRYLRGQDVDVWDSGQVNAYSGSDIDLWFNNTYKTWLDTAVQVAIGTTKFYYTSGNGTSTVTTLERGVFALSTTELSAGAYDANAEGTALPIASTLQKAYLASDAANAKYQWTRTPLKSSTWKAYYLNQNGVASDYDVTKKRTARPAFTLPATTLFDEETLLFKGVS